MTYQLVLYGGMIVDGSGSPARKGTVACRDGKIVLLPADSRPAGDKMIDVTGLWVCPGFIDPHSHGDAYIGKACNSLAKLSQGITTHIGGQCGSSHFPVRLERLNDIKDVLGLKKDESTDYIKAFSTFAGYLEHVNRLSFPENIGFFTGHEVLRLSAMGYDNRRPTPKEMDDMKAALEETLQNGAMGMSTGLIYIPGSYADIDELTQLCHVLARYDRIYATHMRDEGDNVLAAMEEAIELGRRTGCRVNISHLKVCGKANHGLAPKMLDLIHAARAEGIRVSADQYPYLASSTSLMYCIPHWHYSSGFEQALSYIQSREGREQIKSEILNPESRFDNIYMGCGGFDGALVARCAVTKDAEGKTVAQWGRLNGMDGFEAFFALLTRNHGDVTGIYFDTDEKDVITIMQDRDLMVGTDGAIGDPDDLVHPRTFGAFPRALGLYARDKGVMPMEEMIRKMTSRTAEVFSLNTKGRIADGMDADLVILNPETVRDTADFDCPTRLADGIEQVVVAGKVVYQNHKLTGENPGKVVLAGRSSI